MMLRAIVIILFVCRTDAAKVSVRPLFCQDQQENAIWKLLHRLEEDTNQIDEYLLSDGWVSLAKLAAASHDDRIWLKRNVAALVPVVQNTIQVLSREEIEARAIATIAHRAARIVLAVGRSKTMTALFEALAAAATQQMGNFNRQELANTAWAFAKVDHKDNQLFAALAKAAEQ